MTIGLPVIHILLVWLPTLYLALRWLPLQGPGRGSFCLGASGIAALVFSGAVLWLGLVISGRLLAWLPVALLVAPALLSAALARDWLPPPAAGSGFVIGRAERVAIVVLSLLIAIRVLSLLPDVMLRPLFAWDAWTVWGYEARVWLETGGFQRFESPRAWLSAPADFFVRDTLVVYPKLVQALILWTVPVGADWTGVGPGVLWLAVAGFTGLVIFGTARFAGASPAWALGGLYVYSSLPLLGTHIALYGYADLWMAALLSVLAGLLVLFEASRRAFWGLLILLVLGALPLIKVEGAYWVVCGLVAWFMAWAGFGVRSMVWVCLAAVAGVLLSTAIGIDPLNLLTAGRLELAVDGLPAALAGAGRHAFVWFDWHLMGYLTLALVVLLAVRPGLAEKLKGLTALSLLGLVMLWGFTPLTGAGQFLSAGTLFSRIFLQFSPVVILLGILIFGRAWAHFRHADLSLRSSGLRRTGTAMILSALILWAGWTAWMFTPTGFGQVLQARTIHPETGTWRMVEGEGEVTEHGYRVTAPGMRGRVLLAVELPAGFNTEDYDRIEFRFRDSGPSQLELGWSRTSQFQPLDWVLLGEGKDGVHVARLDSEPRWLDPVYFLAIEQQGFSYGPWTLESIIMHPSQPGLGRIQRVLADSAWIQSAWTQRNPHFVWTFDQVPRVSVVIAVALWILLTGVLIFLQRRRFSAGALVWLSLPVALGWLALDLRWQLELGYKAHATVTAFSGKAPRDRFGSDIDGDLFEFLQHIQESHARSAFERVFAFSELEFWRKRARYHLASWGVRPAHVRQLNPALVRRLRPGDLLLLLETPGLQVRSVAGGDADLIELRSEDDDVLLLGERILEQSDWIALRVR